MSEIERRPSGVVETVEAVISDGMKYVVLLARLTAAGVALRNLSGTVRDAYTYVEGCATSVDRLADRAASLEVDALTVGEHHDAAAVMRSVLAEADAMAEAAADLSVAFEETAAAHEADYGSVAEAANTMPDGVPMANRRFYSNR